MTVESRHIRKAILKIKQTNLMNTQSNNNSNMVTMNVSDLEIHPTLKKLGIESLSQFEIEVNRKFGVSNELVIANQDNLVLSNWEYVAASNDSTIDVAKVNLTDDELVILLASKNLRKWLKQGSRITLAVLLRDSLKRTGYLREILAEIPGRNFTERVAKLAGSSYGTFQKYFLIDKYAPQLKSLMDEGKCSLEQAVQIAMESRAGIKRKRKHETAMPDATESGNGNSKPKGKNGNLSIERFAGFEKFKPCEMFKGITIRRFDGTEIDVTAKDNHIVQSKRGFKDDRAEYYQIFNPETQAFIQITINNIENL